MATLISSQLNEAIHFEPHKFSIRKCTHKYSYAYKIAINHVPNWIVAQAQPFGSFINSIGIHLVNKYTITEQSGHHINAHNIYMKLSIFDHSVYIRSLKLNGSTDLMRILNVSTNVKCLLFEMSTEISVFFFFRSLM